MNAIMQQLVNQKINSLTTNELLDLASNYQVPLTHDQAQHVMSILHSETINIGNKDQINRLLHRLQTEIDEHVSLVIEQLVQQFSHFLD